MFERTKAVDVPILSFAPTVLVTLFVKPTLPQLDESISIVGRRSRILLSKAESRWSCRKCRRARKMAEKVL
jgi:hypothetical protein